MKTVLVTGAAGFVGAHVVATLLDRGHRVRTLEHRTPVPESLRRDCEIVSGDIRDASLIKEALDQVNVVCHLAAYVPQNLSGHSEAEACYQFNALATLGLATEAVNSDVERFVYASSGSVYSANSEPCTEADSAFPDQHATSYSTSKLCGEIYLSNVGRRSGMESLILRIGAPYGPGSPDRSVVSTFMRRAASGESLRLLNGGLARYNFVWVGDVAQCVVRAAESGQSGIYNVASGEYTSLHSLVDAVVSVYKETKPKVQVDPPSGEVAGLPALSIERARKTWEFDPLSLTEGLNRYKKWINGRVA